MTDQERIEKRTEELRLAFVNSHDPCSAAADALVKKVAAECAGEGGCFRLQAANELQREKDERESQAYSMKMQEAAADKARREARAEVQAVIARSEGRFEHTMRDRFEIHDRKSALRYTNSGTVDGVDAADRVGSDSDFKSDAITHVCRKLGLDREQADAMLRQKAQAYLTATTEEAAAAEEADQKHLDTTHACEVAYMEELRQRENIIRGRFVNAINARRRLGLPEAAPPTEALVSKLAQEEAQQDPRSYWHKWNGHLKQRYWDPKDGAIDDGGDPTAAAVRDFHPGHVDAGSDGGDGTSLDSMMASLGNGD